MNDGDLDDLLKSVLRDFPNAGYTRMSGLPLARGTRPRQSRIRSAVQGVNPEGRLPRAQEPNALHRQSHQAHGTSALWHFDGNHKPTRQTEREGGVFPHEAHSFLPVRLKEPAFRPTFIR